MLMSSPSILVVEDEAVIALDLRFRLERAGYEVCAIATTKDEAVQLTRTRQPTLVLMDIRLEGGSSGIDAAHEIRLNHQTPVIFLTAYADEGTIEKAKLTRPYGYIMKPFKDQELRAAIEIAIYRYQTEPGMSVSGEGTVSDSTIYSAAIANQIKSFSTEIGTVTFFRLPADTGIDNLPPEAIKRFILVPADDLYLPFGVELVGPIYIGRNAHGLHIDLDLSPFDAERAGVSRQHAMIRAENNHLYIYDIGSTNGTYVNRTRAWLGRPLKLTDGDIIEFGTLAFRISLID
jgi:two-component system, response regulator PdtaR